MKRFNKAVLSILSVFFACLASADELPISFINNGIKLLVSGAGSGDRAVIKLEVKAPQRSEVKILTAHNPARLILDFRNAQLTRNRTFPINSNTVRSVRFGVHPGFFRVVVEFTTKEVPHYTTEEEGDWFTLIAADPVSGKDGPSEPGDRPWERRESEFKFAAHLWNKTTHDLKDDGGQERDKTNTMDLRPELVYLDGNTFDATVSSRLLHTYEFGNVEEGDFEARLYNAYLSYTSDWYSIKAGNQIVTWGKADEISPLDNINPEDLRDGAVRRRTERKIPIPIINIETFARGDRLQAIYIPVYKRSRIDYFDNDWAITGNSIGELALDEDRPSSGLSGGSEYGFRFMSDAFDVDYSISFLSSTSDLPSLGSMQLPLGVDRVPPNATIRDLAEFANNTGQPLPTEFNRRDVVGFDFETVLGNLGFRGDFAYTAGEDFLNDRLEAKRHATYKYVLGVDYTSASDFYVNLQFIQSIIDGFTSDLLFSEEVQSGFFGEISQELFDNNLKFGFRALNNFPLRQYFYNPYLKAQYWDNFNFEIGVDILGGEEQAPLGFFTDNDQAYITINAFY